MKFDPVRHDAELTDTLAGVIGYLRAGRYATIRDNLDVALRGAADRFVVHLAEHLDGEEAVLFPALRAAAPSHALALDALVLQHGRLRQSARKLADEIVRGERDAAMDTARVFLAELFEHIRREDECVAGAVDGLGTSALARFGEDVFAGRARHAARRLAAEHGADVEVVSALGGALHVRVHARGLAADEIARKLREEFPDAHLQVDRGSR